MEADSSILKTDVDDFIELIKQEGKMTISDAAKRLGVSEITVEAWTDFLVEERILGIEYKFTTPYIFMNIHDESESKGMLGLETKEIFFEKARMKSIPQYQAVTLWVKYLSVNKDKIKSTFMQKAKSRGLSTEKRAILWRKYYEHLRSG